MTTATFTVPASARFAATVRATVRGIVAEYGAVVATFCRVPKAPAVTARDRARAVKFGARVGAAPTPRQPFAPAGWDEGDAE